MHLAALSAPGWCGAAVHAVREDGFEFGLADSAARAIWPTKVDGKNLLKMPRPLPFAADVYVIHRARVHAGAHVFWRESGRRRSQSDGCTCADDPAIIIYTSGTTGPPKGALHAHRVLIGHVPMIAMVHEFLAKTGD